MKGYLIAMVDVSDPEAYKQYSSRTPDIIARHGGRFLVRGGEVVALEGKTPAGRLVVLEFASVAAARTFYDSEDYQAILPYRTAASRADFLLVEGCEPPIG